MLKPLRGKKRGWGAGKASRPHRAWAPEQVAGALVCRMASHRESPSRTDVDGQWDVSRGREVELLRKFFQLEEGMSE